MIESNEATNTSPVVPRKTKHRDVDEEHNAEKQGARHALVVMSTISLTAVDLYDKDKVDLESIELEDVFSLLQVTPEGLTSVERQRRLELFGPNCLESEERNPILHFLSFLWNPLSWVMEGAAIVAIALSNGESRPPDWQDFLGIVVLLLINATIGFMEERSAGSAVQALMDSLAPKANVKRDGSWLEVESSDLVPGDVCAFKHGQIIPADCRLLEGVNVSIDQAALTGESLPCNKKVGDLCFSGSTCKQGEGEAVVIATGSNTFIGRATSLIGADAGESSHLQTVLAKIGLFCMSSIALFVIIEILVLYPAYKYSYRDGIDAILVLLIGGIPIAMPCVLTVTLAIGATQLAKHKAIVTRITAIEELAGVTILCSDKTGTLTANVLTIDTALIKCYSTFNADDIIRFAAYASRTENMDAIDTAVVGTLPKPAEAHTGIKVLNFKPFDPVDKRTEVTYRIEATGEIKRACKGMSSVVTDLATRNKTQRLEDTVDADVDEFANRGLRALAVAVENVTGDPDGPGDGYELVGLLAILDPPRHDTKETIERAQALGIEVKMVTGDQLSIAKETGRRLGLGGANPEMWPANVLKTGILPPEAAAKYANLDEMILKADGFAGVFPEHKYEIVKRLQNQGHLTAMTGDGANDAPALSKANVGIAVEGATDAARGASDIVLIEPGLSTIIEAITQSRIVFARMRGYSIYACSVTIRILVGFTALNVGFRLNMPPFMVLIIALLNDGTIMTLSLDRVQPSATPDHWDLAEIFTYAIVYGLYLAASTIVFYALEHETNFFQDTFGVNKLSVREAHMAIYLQVAIISQALIFCTRSHGWSWGWKERPSVALLGAFMLAQAVASIIAAFADWGFTLVSPISGGWILIVWVWTIIWYLPLDVVKFSVRAVLKRFRKAPIPGSNGSTDMHRVASRHESLYAPRTTFIKRARNRLGLGGKKLHLTDKEIGRISSIQTQQAGTRLSMAGPPSRLSFSDRLPRV